MMSPTSSTPCEDEELDEDEDEDEDGDADGDEDVEVEDGAAKMASEQSWKDDVLSMFQ